MRIDSAARTETGCVRSRNEDACCLWPWDGAGERETAYLLLAVADGMGGHPGGDLASMLAISMARELAAEPEAKTANPDLRGLFFQASRRIEESWHREPQYKEMGTTLTVASFFQGQVSIGHIGDSRLYWIRGDRVVQVTRDHTVAQELVDAGALPAAEADGHPTSHILTRCLGVCPDQGPDILAVPLRLEPGDRLLLASDGLVKAVPTTLLGSMSAHGDAGAAVDRLVEAALDAGAPDNVTVVLARILDLGPDAVAEGLAFSDPLHPVWRRS